MAYITNDDIVARVGTAAAVQLTTDSGDTPDSAVLDRVRLAAEGEVNGYIGKRYAVPVDLSAHPESEGLVVGVTLNVAVYHLNSRRPPAAEAYEPLYKHAKEWLMGVARGDIVLPAATTPASTTADDPMAGWGSSTPNMSRGEAL